jgi:hypothetical protein
LPTISLRKFAFGPSNTKAILGGGQNAGGKPGFVVANARAELFIV